MRSAVGIRTHSRKRGEPELGSREPPAAACRSPQPSSAFGEDGVLASSLSRKNEVKPPVHRVRQRDLLCGDLLALPDARPGSLRLPQEPAPRGFLSSGKHRRGRPDLPAASPPLPPAEVPHRGGARPNRRRLRASPSLGSAAFGRRRPRPVSRRLLPGAPS